MTLDNLTRREFIGSIGALAVALAAGCGTPTKPEEDKTFVELRTKSPTGGTLYQSLRIPKLEYAVGEEVPFEYKVEGEFTPPFPFDWWVHQGDREIYSPDYAYAHSASSSSKTFNDSWDQKDEGGNQVLPGEYTLYVGGGNFPRIYLDFAIKE